ncbi:hypothetical protein GCM10007940_03020 [Portibacter lacus]|uniref:Uncharacterized protein n=1 Tax=Portibacter lacus TaxID=1099794 RepID=A0AA37WD92_9BACT|nr:hypothetical protein GCM10007940_03020 [Portibacter lacus]
MLWAIGKPKTHFFFKFVSFVGIYLIVVLFVVPPLASIYGKVPMPNSKQGNLIPHNLLYPLLNRNYVTPQTLSILLKTADEVQLANENLKLVYLDSSFPFSKEMPLPPHISHSNGRKVDLCFAYKKDGQLTNKGSCFTGYGNFVGPKSGETDQIEICKSSGHQLYDASRYAGFFKKKDYVFDEVNTKLIIDKLLENQETSRIYIETHLKERLGIQSEKVRSAGCWAVRHDDHIHFQIGGRRR